MGRDELIGNTALYGGSLATCGTAPAAYATESTMLLIFSAIGGISAVLGLAYTVWNGNRNFRLAQEDILLKRREHNYGNENRPLGTTIQVGNGPQGAESA